MPITLTELTPGGVGLQGLDAVPGLRENGLGVWKQYGVDSLNDPIGGITIGNGTMRGYWWTDHPVVASVDTPPFLCHIWIEVVFGSTTTVDDFITCNLPWLTAEGLGLFADVLDGSPVFWAYAFLNGNLVFADLARYGGTIGYAGMGTEGPWDADYPVAWGNGHSILISGSFRAKFIID
jgi:hypothetical protein